MSDEPIRVSGRIAEEYPHVWDQRGAPMGTVHEIVGGEDGRVTFRERWTGLAGEDVPPVEVTMGVSEAVHLVLNMTDEERQRFAVERTQRPKCIGPRPETKT